MNKKMCYTSSEELKEMKEDLLKILEWFHNYCIENSLRYYIAYGTMLGAVRHKGFIPWDDDLDVVMPRPDYMRLMNLCAKESTGRYKVEFYGKNDDYVHPFGKVYDTNTILTEKMRKNLRRGVYMDIFPLDGAGNSMEDAVTVHRQVNSVRNRLILCTSSLHPKRAVQKNFLVFMGKFIPRSILNPQRLIRKMESLSQKYDYDKSSYVANYSGEYKTKEITPKAYYGEPKEYQFENLTVLGVEKPDEYLRNYYGDYMKFPPVEQRVSRHTFVEFDLKHSYLD